MADFDRATEQVCDIFKVSSLYSEQIDSLRAVLDGKNVYASLPTGYGKSMIFFAVPIVADVHRLRDKESGLFTLESGTAECSAIFQIFMFSN